MLQKIKSHFPVTVLIMKQNSPFGKMPNAATSVAPVDPDAIMGLLISGIARRIGKA